MLTFLFQDTSQAIDERAGFNIQKDLVKIGAEVKRVKLLAPRTTQGGNEKP